MKIGLGADVTVLQFAQYRLAVPRTHIPRLCLRVHKGSDPRRGKFGCSKSQKAATTRGFSSSASTSHLVTLSPILSGPIEY